MDAIGSQPMSFSGYPQPAEPVAPGRAYAQGKNPLVACILSLLIVGTGQFYNGEWGKGLAMLLTCIFATTLSFGTLWFFELSSPRLTRTAWRTRKSLLGPCLFRFDPRSPLVSQRNPRTKVLHPDRFDREKQEVEWQMANDMLQELNEAYSQVRGAAGNNGASTNGSSSVTAKKTQKFNYPDDSVDKSRTIYYWNQLAELFSRTEQVSVPNLDQDNIDLHLAGLNQYIQVNFQSEYGISLLDRTGVDPIALQIATLTKECLVTLSRLIADRSRLLQRLKFLKSKYPFWKTWWVGLDALNISLEEHNKDMAE